MQNIEKKKILVLSDHPLVPSGVGTQTRYVIEGLLKTGKYKFVCLGGAVKHPDYRPQKVEPEKYGDDWLIFPVNGYGDKDILRKMLAVEKPDALLFVTDPRFYVWLWEIEDEVRAICPMIYWHVWDDDPAPDFNLPFYNSTDSIQCISMKTLVMLRSLGVKHCEYLPHAVEEYTFKPVSELECQLHKKQFLGPHAETPFVVFWNNRNARRKQPGDVIFAFSEFVKKIGRGKACLLMHTDPFDPEGQNLILVARKFGVEKELVISNQRLDSPDMAKLYNLADVTMNIASNEGFGLSTLESLYCGTPIIAHVTGGLQYQLGPWWKNLTNEQLSDQVAVNNMIAKRWKSSQDFRNSLFGVPVPPGSRSVTGSQQIPYICDDKVAHEDVVEALMYMYKMTRTERRELGLLGSQWVRKEFSMSSMITLWDEVIEKELSSSIDKKKKVARVSSL